MSEGGQTSTAAFKYDALGRRIERIVTQGASTQRTQYVYDGIQAIGELADGQLAATILTGLNIDEVIARTVNVSGGANPTATKSYLTDALGSVLTMTNQAQGPEVFYGYSAYGETQALGVDGDIPNNSNQYTARENDGLIGGTSGGALYYYRARYYDPVLKRFLSEDLIGLRGGFNVYAYVGGSPVNYSDARGLDNPRMGPYNPPEPCACEGGPRLPDFYSASLSVAVPFTGNLGSWTFSVSIDRFGNWFYSPIGPGVGRALTALSFTGTANWLVQGCKPAEDQLANFLSGHGISIAGGYWGGANAIYSPGNGWAAGVGIVTPQLGANYSYSFQGSGTGGTSP